MAIERETDGDRGLIEDLFRCLRDATRRRMLYRLLEHNPQEAIVVPDDVHEGRQNIGSLHRELYHRHLPMLDEIGFVRWDRERDQYHIGPRFEKVSDLLDEIRQLDESRISD